MWMEILSISAIEDRYRLPLPERNNLRTGGRNTFASLVSAKRSYEPFLKQGTRKSTTIQRQPISPLHYL